MPDLYLAEIAAYDPSVPGAITLRYATRGFVTGPAEAPANTCYDYRLKQPINVIRDCWASGTTSGRSRTGFGDLILLNGDGALDALLTYGLDGRVVTIRHATVADPAYPGDFTTVFVGTMEQPICGLEEIRIRIRDRQYETHVPLQVTKYLGNNVLPAGLEGVADDLKGKPKPVCLGSVLNVPAVCVNTSKLIYQVHDGAINDVNEIYDRGIPLFSDVWDLPVSNNTAIYAVASDGAGKLVTVGTFPATSVDGGATWVQRAWSGVAGGIDTAARSVAFGAGLFVAGGYNSTAPGAAAIETSPDGIVWTKRTTAFTGTDYVEGVCWDGTRFVAVSGNEIATSLNGINWTLRVWAGTVTSWLGVTAGGVLGNARLVAVGTGGTMATSDDGGVTWVERDSAFGATDIYDVAYGRGTYLAVGASGKVATSTDGLLWVVQDVGFASDTVYAATYGAGRFVVAGVGYISPEGGISTSFDGASWQRRTADLTTYVRGLAYVEGVFVAVGNTMVAVNEIRRADYANAVDLEDDALAPKPGQIGVYPAGGYFRLGSSPAGLITADVTQGAAAANRTAAQLANIVLDRAIPGASFVAADVAALDAANASVLGYWQGPEETTCNAVLDLIANTVGAWWGVDAAGLFRIKRLIAPAGAAAATFVASDVVKGSLQRIAALDEGNGLPVYRETLRWGRVYAVQDTDLAAGVSDARRGVVSKEWREVIYSDATVQTQFLLALALVEDSLFTTAADALTEATRRQVLRGVRRDRYELTVVLDTETAALDLGNVITLIYNRYDLWAAGAGKKFIVTGVAPDAMARKVRFNLWG